MIVCGSPDCFAERRRTAAIFRSNIGIEKGFVKRVEPGFICQPLIEREDVHNAKFIDILRDYYSNSRSYFLSAFVKESPLTDEEVQRLNDIVERLK